MPDLEPKSLDWLRFLVIESRARMRRLEPGSFEYLTCERIMDDAVEEARERFRVDLERRANRRADR